MVAQGQSRVEGKAEFTKHMIRMRHAGHVSTKPEANEIILINSHDGASSYQMLAGVFRFVCCNGLVVGNVSNDIRIPHKGNIQGEVIEGAFRVLEDFEAVDASTESMKVACLTRWSACSETFSGFHGMSCTRGSASRFIVRDGAAGVASSRGQPLCSS